MVKLKDLLNESAPGFENRQFGDPLPKLADITKKYQEKNGIVEAISKEKIDVKKVAANMRKDKSGFFGNSWAKAIMKKYPNGVSENDLQMDLPDYIAGSAITNLFK